MTYFKIIHIISRYEDERDGETTIEKIFSGRYPEPIKNFELLFDKGSRPYPELMDTMHEKIHDFLKDNYNFRIHQFHDLLHIGFQILIEPEAKDGHIFNENDLKPLISLVAYLVNKFNIFGDFCVEESYTYLYGKGGFLY